MSTPHLLSSYRDSVLTLTVNRPDKRNALSLALLDDLAATLAAHRNEPGLRAVVITAAGDRCFAAGGDLKELEAVRSEAEAAISMPLVKQGRALPAGSQNSTRSGCRPST